MGVLKISIIVTIAAVVLILLIRGGVALYQFRRRQRAHAHFQDYYAQAKEELRLWAVKSDTWESALEMADGDIETTKIHYLRLRVQEQRALDEASDSRWWPFRSSASPLPDEASQNH